MQKCVFVLTIAATLGVFGGAQARAQASPQASPQGSFNVEECVTCHDKTVHSGFERTPHSQLAQSCASCHANVAEHARAEVSGGTAPLPSLKTLKAREVDGVCLTCHDKGRQASFPGGLHDRRDLSCITCHSVHSFKSAKAQLKSVRDSDTCFSCHKAAAAMAQRTSHHPIREGKMECTSCHDPHNSTNPKMISASSVNEKCYECHTEKRGPFLWEHAPVRESCVTCHNPHGSNHPRMTVAMQPYLCQRCHANSGHPGTIYDANNAIGGALVAAASPAGITTTQTIVSPRILSRGCANCHNQIHGSNSPSGVAFGR